MCLLEPSGTQHSITAAMQLLRMFALFFERTSTVTW